MSGVALGAISCRARARSARREAARSARQGDAGEDLGQGALHRGDRGERGRPECREPRDEVKRDGRADRHGCLPDRGRARVSILEPERERKERRAEHRDLLREHAGKQEQRGREQLLPRRLHARPPTRGSPKRREEERTGEEIRPARDKAHAFRDASDGARRARRPRSPQAGARRSPTRVARRTRSRPRTRRDSARDIRAGYRRTSPNRARS